MAQLTQQQIDAILESMKELEEFKDAVTNTLKKRKLTDDDLKLINMNLGYIESNTANIIDLLSPNH